MTIAPPTNRTIVAAADSQGYNPCIGYEDAIPEEARDGNHAIYCGPDELERVSFVIPAPPARRSFSKGGSNARQAGIQQPGLLRFKQPSTLRHFDTPTLLRKGNIEWVGDRGSGFGDRFGHGELVESMIRDIQTSRLPDIQTFFLPSAYALPVVVVPLSKEPKKLTPAPANKLPAGKLPAMISPINIRPQLLPVRPGLLPAHPEPVEGRFPVLPRRRPQFGVAQSICNTSGVGCCSIAADGSFECYPLSGHGELVEPSTFVIQVVDIRDGNVGEPVFEDQNNRFLWMRQKPVANTSVKREAASGERDALDATRSTQPAEVFALGDPPSTNNNVVKITEDDGTFMVIGDWRERYKHNTVNAHNARGIAYDPLLGDEGLVALRNPTDPLHVHNVLMLDDVTAVAVPFEERVEPDTREYTASKLASNGKLMFGRKGMTVEPTAKIHYAPDFTVFDPDPLELGTIEFLTGAAEIDHDENFVPFLHKKTHTFDVDGEYAIVVWEDDRGNLRLRMSNGEAERTVETELGRNSAHLFADIQLYHDNPTSANKGRALLLDTQTESFAIVRFNRRGSPSGLSVELEDANPELDIDDPWIKVGSGKNPQAFVLNAEKTKAYIINKGDETVSEITLKDSPSGSPRSAASVASSLRHINVADYFPGKDFTYKPTHAAYHVSSARANDRTDERTNDSLLIGMEDMKGSLVLPISSLSEHRTVPRPNNLLFLRPELLNNLPSTDKTLRPQDAKTPRPPDSKTSPVVKPLWFDSKLPAKDGSSKKESPKGKSPGTTK